MKHEIKTTQTETTIINLAKQDFKKLGMDGLPLSALGLSSDAMVTVSHAVMNSEYVDWNFESHTVKSLELGASAKVIGISDHGFILIQEDDDFMVLMQGV